MKVFHVSGRFQQNGKWSESKTPDFSGYIMQKKENSDEFIGFMNELYETNNIEEELLQLESSDPNIRAIRGFYNKEKNQLIFLKMSNTDLDPLLYVFPDLNKDGLWSALDPILEAFFYGKHLDGGIREIADGMAKILIEEITDETEKERTRKKIQEEYIQFLEVAFPINIKLMGKMEAYKEFLSINFENFRMIENKVCVFHGKPEFDMWEHSAGNKIEI